MPPKTGSGLFVLALVMFALGLLQWPKPKQPLAEVRAAREMKLLALETQLHNPLTQFGERCGPYLRYVSPANDPAGTGYVILTEQRKESTATFIVGLDKLQAPQSLIAQSPCLQNN